MPSVGCGSTAAMLVRSKASPLRNSAIAASLPLAISRGRRDVEVGVVAQEDAVRPQAHPRDRLEHVAAMAGGDIEDAHGLPLAARSQRLPQQLLDMRLALADAAPADRIEIGAVDDAAEHAAACRLVAIDVVERRAGIEAGRVAEPMPSERAGGLQVHALYRPIEAARREHRKRRGQPVRLVAREADAIGVEQRCVLAGSAKRSRRKSRTFFTAIGGRVRRACRGRTRAGRAAPSRRAEAFVEAVLRAVMHDPVAPEIRSCVGTVMPRASGDDALAVS